MDICTSVIEICKDKGWANPQLSVSGENFAKINWLDGNPNNITQQMIETKKAELKANYDNLAYARNREKAYPSIEDVTVALAEKAEGDSTFWDEITKKRADVKKKYPKP